MPTSSGLLMPRGWDNRKKTVLAFAVLYSIAFRVKTRARKLVGLLSEQKRSLDLSYLVEDNADQKAGHAYSGPCQKAWCNLQGHSNPRFAPRLLLWPG